MKRKAGDIIMKRAIYLIGTFLAVFLFAACSGKPIWENTPLAEMKISVLDLDGAGCTVLQNSGETMIIDAGNIESPEAIEAFLNREGITKIKYLVLTRLDLEHMGAAPRLIRGYSVENIIQSHESNGSPLYGDYYTAAEQQGLTPQILRKQQTVSLGDARIALLPAEKEVYKDNSDYAIMAQMVYGDKRFLFAGDAGEQRLREYLSSSPKRMNFAKLPACSAYTEMTGELIDTVSPEYAVIPCAGIEQPCPEEECLRKENSRILRTDEGTVTALCTGDQLTVFRDSGKENPNGIS